MTLNDSDSNEFRSDCCDRPRCEAESFHSAQSSAWTLAYDRHTRTPRSGHSGVGGNGRDGPHDVTGDTNTD
jgi:hypothetical protein